MTAGELEEENKSRRTGELEDQDIAAAVFYLAGPVRMSGTSDQIGTSGWWEFADFELLRLCK